MIYNSGVSAEVVPFVTQGSSHVWKESRSWKRFFEIRAALKRGEFDLVLCGANPMDIWPSDRFFLRNAANMLNRLVFRPYTLWMNLLPALLDGVDTPMLGTNWVDTPMIGRHQFYILKRCAAYFMRECPQNIWNAFLFTSSKRNDTINVRRDPFIKKQVEKIHPLPIGIAQGKLEKIPFGIPKKTDVFFAGGLDATPVRRAGLQLLEELGREGYTVDVSMERLPQDIFFRRCAEARIVWSPEGVGWDCDRHYEAAAAGSVPLINYPTIRRHAPFIGGETALYYGMEGDHLKRVVKDALRDSGRVERMGAAAREHLLQHHTRSKILDYMLETLVARGGADLRNRLVGK